MCPKQTRSGRGFTLVELVVVVAILGALAAFTVPRFLASVERSKAAGALSFLATVHAAQERHHARHGAFASDLAQLDTPMVPPGYFSVGGIAAPSGSLETGWELTLTRAGATGGYGPYTIVFNQNGFDIAGSTISADITLLQSSAR